MSFNRKFLFSGMIVSGAVYWKRDSGRTVSILVEYAADSCRSVVHQRLDHNDVVGDFCLDVLAKNIHFLVIQIILNFRYSAVLKKCITSCHFYNFYVRIRSKKILNSSNSKNQIQ